MRVLLNIIWFVFGGIWLALSYLLLGIIACILIIGIPWGIGAFRIAGYALWPFGRTIVRKPSAGAGSAVGNVIWAVLAGIWIVISHALTALAQAITIIGIPLALANLKMIPVSLRPLGKDVVHLDDLRPGHGTPSPIAADGLPGSVISSR